MFLALSFYATSQWAGAYNFKILLSRPFHKPSYFWPHIVPLWPIRRLASSINSLREGRADHTNRNFPNKYEYTKKQSVLWLHCRLSSLWALNASSDGLMSLRKETKNSRNNDILILAREITNSLSVFYKIKISCNSYTIQTQQRLTRFFQCFHYQRLERLYKPLWVWDSFSTFLCI